MAQVEEIPQAPNQSAQPLDTQVANGCWRSGWVLMLGLGGVGVVVPIFGLLLVSPPGVGSGQILGFLMMVGALLMLPVIIVAFLRLNADYERLKRSHSLRIDVSMPSAVAKGGLIVLSSIGFQIAATRYMPAILGHHSPIRWQGEYPTELILASATATVLAFGTMIMRRFDLSGPTEAAVTSAVSEQGRGAGRQLVDALGLIAIAYGVPTILVVPLGFFPDFRDVFSLLAGAANGLASGLGVLQLIQALRSLAGTRTALFAWSNLLATLALAFATALAVVAAPTMLQ